MSVVRVRMSRLDPVGTIGRDDPRRDSSDESLDSTVAESVAVEVRMISVLPDRRFGCPGLGPAGFGRGSWRSSMHTIGVLLLAAATAGDGFGYDKPGVGLKKWLRPHAVVSSRSAPRAARNIRPRPWAAARRRGRMAAGGRRFVNTKSQIYFLDPDGMNIGWQTGAGPNGERAYLARPAHRPGPL